MTDLVTKSLTELSKLIRSRSASPVEILEAYLDQIARLNPALNAIVNVAPDLIDRAQLVEAAVLRGENSGSLHGVPITIKDTIETQGLVTTSGSVMRAD